MQNLGNRLRNVRQDKRLSLRDLEKITGIHYSIISQYENHHYLPQIDHLVKLSGSLAINLHWLITGKGPKELPGTEREESIGRIKSELAAARRQLQEAEEQIKELKLQHYDDLKYITELQKELLRVKNQK